MKVFNVRKKLDLEANKLMCPRKLWQISQCDKGLKKMDHSSCFAQPFCTV